MHTGNAAEDLNDFSEITNAPDAADYVDYLKHNNLPEYEKYQAHLKQSENGEKQHMHVAYIAARDAELDRGSRRMSRLLAGSVLIGAGLIGLLFHANKFFSKDDDGKNTDPNQNPGAPTPT